MFVALTATIACSDDGDDGDVNPIVGTWWILGPVLLALKLKM